MKTIRFVLGCSLSIALLVPAGCRRTEQTPVKASIVSEGSQRRKYEEWKAKRADRLRSPNGWLTLVGLFWLQPGENAFGSAASNPIVLPAEKTPPVAGSLVLQKDGRVRLEPRKDSGLTVEGRPAAEPVVLKSDAEGEPTTLRIGSVAFYVIKRGDKLGVRVKDGESEALKNFRGLDYFPFDPKWQIVAHLEPYDPPKKIEVLNVLGQVEDMPSPGALVFTAGGQRQRLEPVLEKGSTDLFVIFADATSGKETYGAGRFLYASPADAGGNVVLDFNQAYNPPCAFTRFATCPLPPPQNRLRVRVEAGEKKFGEGHS